MELLVVALLVTIGRQFVITVLQLAQKHLRSDRDNTILVSDLIIFYLSLLTFDFKLVDIQSFVIVLFVGIMTLVLITTCFPTNGVRELVRHCAIPQMPNMTEPKLSFGRSAYEMAFCK